jgi:hypothetical protein
MWIIFRLIVYFIKQCLKGFMAMTEQLLNTPISLLRDSENKQLQRVHAVTVFAQYAAFCTFVDYHLERVLSLLTHCTNTGYFEFWINVIHVKEFK